MKTKEFRSEFDNDVIVSIIDNNDFRYSVVKPLFESYGFGFMITANISEKLMLIDGEQKLNKHILKWIEAHEVAHFILGHGLTQNNSAEEEIEAVEAWRMRAYQLTPIDSRKPKFCLCSADIEKFISE